MNLVKLLEKYDNILQVIHHKKEELANYQQNENQQNGN